MRTVTFKADDSLLEIIENRAEADGCSISHVIRRALENEFSGGVQKQILQLQIVTLGTLLNMPGLDKKGSHRAIEHIAKNLDSFAALAEIEEEYEDE